MGDLPGFLDFTRPGNDCVDDSRYHPFVRFWKRYGRNFLKLLQLNLVYAVLTLPIYVWMMSLINGVLAQATGSVVSLLGSVLLYAVMSWPSWLLALLVGVSIVLLGPATAALSYAALNCAWDRPGLFWPGFRQAWKENWKQALPIGLADAVVCFSTLYYLVDGVTAFGNLGAVLRILWLFLVLIYAMVRVYLYPVMVTVELPFGALLRNCLSLALLKPWRPLLVILIAAVLGIGCMLADLVLVPCFLYSFVAFSAAFLTQPMIEKYLLNPQDSASK